MNNIITQISEKIINNTEEIFSRVLAEGLDLADLIQNTQKTLNEVGVMIIKEVLESTNDIVRCSPDRKKKFVIKESYLENTLLTIFGSITYERTYFKSKKSGEYRFLSDELFGIEAGDKMDILLKSKVIESSLDRSYRKSGNKSVDEVFVSGQTVMNSIRSLSELDLPKSSKPEEGKTLKQVKTLFIEADEDHVALQKGGISMPRLVYVHEGLKEEQKNRKRLINPKYFGGVYKDSEDLWLEVANYIDSTYDRDAIDKIYLSGDGAKWIKSGLGWINKSVYVLDKFHLSKYVKQATAHIAETEFRLWRCINDGNLEGLKAHMSEIYKHTESETKKRAVEDCRRYIVGNWEGIQNSRHKDYFGCSAEGHVSHILSSRLSSRPMGWSIEGVDKMSRLRIYHANGGNVLDLVRYNKKLNQVQREEIKIHQRKINQNKRKLLGGTLGNIPTFTYGKTTGTYKILKYLQGF